MYKDYRDFLKDTIRKQIDFSRTAQSRGKAQPPWQKPCPPGTEKIALPAAGSWKTMPGIKLENAIARRRSRRNYMKQALSLEELAFLLWATQGLQHKLSTDLGGSSLSAPSGGREAGAAKHNFRTVPSAGCRHAIETYIAAFRVAGLGKAIYRYLPLDHALVEVVRYPDLEKRLTLATFGQAFCGSGAATFIWTAIPERMEWRYGDASYKVIALDAGHICQNLYLACENIGAGTCAVAAYDQEAIDKVLGVDGRDEFTIYLAPVGKVGAVAEEG
jgi:SagB-type dehydrogenase family enzyme